MKGKRKEYDRSIKGNSNEIKENESFNQELASRMIGECVLLRQCDAYLRVNISVTAKLFCVSCTELLCTECKNGHVWYKIGKHNFVDATNAPKTPYSVDLKGLDKCEENTKKIKVADGKEIEIKLMPNSISDKNVLTRITSDVYFKPRKGDKTPKCALSCEKRYPLEEGSASRQDLLTEREQLRYDNSIAR